MTIINEMCDHFLKINSKYTYRIYKNGNGEMSIEVQATKSFKNGEMENFAIAIITTVEFDVWMTCQRANDLFLMLRKCVCEEGKCFKLAPGRYEFIEA